MRPCKAKGSRAPRVTVAYCFVFYLSSFIYLFIFNSPKAWCSCTLFNQIMGSVDLIPPVSSMLIIVYERLLFS